MNLSPLDLVQLKYDDAIPAEALAAAEAAMATWSPLPPPPALAAVPSAREAAEAAVVRLAAAAAVAAGRTIYVQARADIAMANRGMVPLGGTGSTSYSRFSLPVARRATFRALNRARARLAANEHRLAAAEAALAALRPAALPLAARAVRRSYTAARPSRAALRTLAAHCAAIRGSTQEKAATRLLTALWRQAERELRTMGIGGQRR